MLVFKRTNAEFIKSILYTLSGALLGFFITSLLELPVWAIVLGAVVLAVAVGILLVAGEALQIEVDSDGTMRALVLGRLRHTFDLSNVELSMPTRLEKKRLRALPNMILHITDPATRKTVKLDCAPLGAAQFDQLCARIREAMDITNQRELDA